MIKRISWFVSGAVAGIASAGYTKRKVKQTAAQMAPAKIANKAVAGAKTRIGNVGEAIRDGRNAMRHKESELRARRDGRVSTLADQLGPNDEVLVNGSPVEPGQVIVMHEYRGGGQAKPKASRRSRRGA
jgi:hypothetical protein